MYASRGAWELAPHLNLLNQKLLEATFEPRKYIISMPPRHGKSELVSKYFPCWFLGVNPDKRFILTSYEADFAASWGKKARNIYDEFGPEIFHLSVSKESSAATRWDVEGHVGGMNTAGAGGPITGKGAHFMVIDDPIKGAKQANSRAEREQQKDWFRSVAYTRIEPGGSIVVMATRWHEDDLSGWILRELNQEKGWEEINLPALASETDPLGRVPGEALWPKRYPRNELLEIQKALGSYWFAALYQGTPQPEGGTLFKRSWFHYFFEETDGDTVYYILKGEDDQLKRVDSGKCYKFQTVDVAATEGERSDYFVIGTFAVTPDKDLLVLDIRRERAETTKHLQLMQSAYDDWRPVFQGVESASYGMNLVQAMKKLGMPVKALKADRDKLSRARPVAARYEAGTVYHRSGASWLGPTEEEMLSFPSGEHDDVVDVIAYAGIELVGHKEPRIRRL